jgi:hypothetical protein
MDGWWWWVDEKNERAKAHACIAVQGPAGGVGKGKEREKEKGEKMKGEQANLALQVANQHGG